MVGDATKTSYASAEQADAEFVKHCLANWASRFEEECARKLVREGEPIETHISFDALLRGDLASRFAAYSTALNNGFLTINEVRERENYAPIDGGDVARAPVNLAIVDPNAAKAGDDVSGLAPATTPTEAPTAGSEDAVDAAIAGEAPVSETALNGAQVTALVDLAAKVKSGELPKASSIAIAKAAFPAIDASVLEAIFADIVEGSAPVVPASRDAKGRYVKRKSKRLADLSPEVQECVSGKIGRLLEEGYDQDQAVAIAISMCTEVEGG
jgi:hypothetical protein